MKLFKFAFATALLIPAINAGLSKQEALAQSSEASHCIQISGPNLYNSCGYTIEVAWCVDGYSDAGYSCNGGYRGMHTFGPYTTYAHFAGDNYVRWVACTGANTLRTEGYDAWCE